MGTKHPHIRLIYSNDTASSQVVFKSQLEWDQLDLFASHKPNAVIFIKPDDLGLDGLSKIISTAHVKRILDLRSLPYLVFDDEPREVFLSLLDEKKIQYLNFYRLIHELSAIRNYIQDGPTAVFCDTAPSHDSAIRLFQKKLEHADIPYSPVYADAEDALLPSTFLIK